MIEITNGMIPADFITAINTNSLQMGDDIDDSMIATYLAKLNQKFNIYDKTYLKTNNQIVAGLSGANFINYCNYNFNLRQDTYNLDLLTLTGSDTFVPATESNAQLAKYKAFKFGGIIHFGILTFQYTYTKPVNPYLFTLTDIDIDTWVSQAADAGIEYLILTMFGPSGFALFDNPIIYPDHLLNQMIGYKKFDVSLVDGDINIIDKFLTACQFYGITAGFYFATVFNFAVTWLRVGGNIAPYSGYTETDKQYYDNYCAKLLQYICSTWSPEYLWLDVAGAGTPCNNMQVLYDAVKNINPNCVVIGNTIGDQDFVWFPYDIGSNEELYSLGGEKTWDTVLATARSHGGTTYYVPQEFVTNIFSGGSASWYWANGKSLKTQVAIQTSYDIAKAHSAPYLLCLAPNTSGIIPQAQLDLFAGISL